ncbi:uncharacterized protein LOC132750880 isoform X2 [Ruditapes philippinarum]|uniref:uncharacterized protein LOC132750880 isoform X2 n=1 Tax=Ruditapes philippinarum TaxID=129788 RepID=UPI00295BA8DF|nr:uncharacterized protein LOC132750880 isoform X2 [Ruditapes philippinarum]
MNNYFAIISVLLVVVNCQSRPPRPPPSMDPRGTPVPMPDSSPAPVSPPRPKGCSPGCGPTEICAELGRSYCRGGQVCSVCIKMSSIRFPASALAGMFAQQTKPAEPAVPAQPVVQVVPQTNPLNSSLNATFDQMLPDTASTVINSLNSNDSQMSLIEYAAKQRNVLPDVGTNNIQDNKLAPSPVKGTTTLDLQLDTKKVKYPIIVTMPDSPNSPNAATKDQSKSIKSSSKVSAGKSQIESHMGHIDQTQMAKWYQRYQLFKAQQARMNGNNIASKPNTDAFDYSTFKKFQQWLQMSQNQNEAQAQTTMVQTAPATVVQTPVPALQPMIQPLGSVLPVVNNPVQPQTVPQFPTPTMQQQFLLWQQQQQQQLQNQANIASVQPQMNVVSGVPQPPSAVPQTNPTIQPAFDYAAFQKQYQQWLQTQGQTQTPATPTVDYTVLQQQWSKQQQQQNNGQNASNNQQTQQTSSQQIQSNTLPNPQTSQAQNTFSYVPQQPVNNYNNDPFFFNFQGPQQNTFAGNSANNDPFAVNNDPFASNNGMMDMMLLGGFGFGGGLFGF